MLRVLCLLTVRRILVLLSFMLRTTLKDRRIRWEGGNMEVTFDDVVMCTYFWDQDAFLYPSRWHKATCLHGKS
jgi:hypothetical protein